MSQMGSFGGDTALGSAEGKDDVADGGHERQRGQEECGRAAVAPETRATRNAHAGVTSQQPFGVMPVLHVQLNGNI